NLLRLDPRDVRDHQLRLRDRVRGDEVVPGQEHVQLASEEEVDPNEQDRRHGRTLSLAAASPQGLTGETAGFPRGPPSPALSDAFGADSRAVTTAVVCRARHVGRGGGNANVATVSEYERGLQ